MFDFVEYGFFADLVVASADDKRISLWHKNGHNMGTIPGTDPGDNIEVIFYVWFCVWNVLCIVQKV